MAAPLAAASALTLPDVEFPAGAAKAEEPPRHSLAPRDEWPWLPLEDGKPLALHPYCGECGLVKHSGGAKALDIGGLANLLAKLGRRLREHGLRLTEAQQRLVLLRLQRLNADDSFGLSRERQLAVVATTVADIARVSPATIASYLRLC